jgi:hypothetical protein
MNSNLLRRLTRLERLASRQGNTKADRAGQIFARAILRAFSVDEIQRMIAAAERGGSPADIRLIPEFEERLTAAYRQGVRELRTRQESSHE